jgi:AraC family transcriptional activator of pobA
MQKSHKVLDFHDDAAKAFGSVSSAEVPRYALYGDDGADLDEMINLEPLDIRCRERGWVVSPHTHPRFTQTIIVTEGSGDLTLEGDIVPFVAPCALIVPPFRIHGLRYEENSKGWVLTIQTPYLNDLLFRAPEFSTLLGEPRHMTLQQETLAGIAAELKSLDAELSGRAVGRAIGAEVRILGLFLNLLRALSPGRSRGAGSSAPEGPIDQLRKYIEAHYREQPSISDMARELGTTTARLRGLCKSETGLSPLEMLHDRIIFEAKRMLVYTSKSISEIGYSLGFSDPAYFNRFFTRFARKSPKQFRSLRQFDGMPVQHSGKDA